MRAFPSRSHFQVETKLFSGFISFVYFFISCEPVRETKAVAFRKPHPRLLSIPNSPFPFSQSENKYLDIWWGALTESDQLRQSPAMPGWQLNSSRTLMYVHSVNCEWLAQNSIEMSISDSYLSASVAIKGELGLWFVGKPGKTKSSWIQLAVSLLATMADTRFSMLQKRERETL